MNINVINQTGERPTYKKDTFIEFVISIWFDLVQKQIIICTINFAIGLFVFTF